MCSAGENTLHLLRQSRWSVSLTACVHDSEEWWPPGAPSLNSWQQSVELSESQVDRQLERWVPLSRLRHVTVDNWQICKSEPVKSYVNKPKLSFSVIILCHTYAQIIGDSILYECHSFCVSYICSNCSICIWCKNTDICNLWISHCMWLIVSHCQQAKLTLKIECLNVLLRMLFPINIKTSGNNKHIRENEVIWE